MCPNWMIIWSLIHLNFLPLYIISELGTTRNWMRALYLRSVRIHICKEFSLPWSCKELSLLHQCLSPGLPVFVRGCLNIINLIQGKKWNSISVHKSLGNFVIMIKPIPCSGVFGAVVVIKSSVVCFCLSTWRSFTSRRRWCIYIGFAICSLICAKVVMFQTVRATSLSLLIFSLSYMVC